MLRASKQTYINPLATGRNLIWMSHACVAAFGLLMAAFSIGLFKAGISMGYLYLLMGVIVSSAVLPASLTLLWRKQNKWAATLSPVLGLACSLTAWLVTAKALYGELSVDTTGRKYVGLSSDASYLLTGFSCSYPMLAGNVVALLSPFIFIPALTFGLGADDYDYESMKDIRRADDHELAQAAHVDLVLVPGENRDDAVVEAEQQQLSRAAFISRLITVTMTIALLILWPMPMYGSGYIFSKKFFTGWVAVGIIWLFFSS